MKLPQKMRFKIMAICLIFTLSALLLQTALFNKQSSTLIYSQAKSDTIGLLENLQSDVLTTLKSMETNLIKVYDDQQLMRDLRNDVELDTLRETYYREAYNLAVENFESTDGVVALYLYNTDDQIISTYRRAVTPRHNYPTDIYENAEEDNADTVNRYVHSDDSTMLVSSYYNTHRETDIVRYVIKLYYNGNSNNVLGYLVCDVDSKVFRYQIGKFITDEDMFIWLQPNGDRSVVSVGTLSEEKAALVQTIAQQLGDGATDIELPPGESGRVLFQLQQDKYNLGAYAMMPQSLLQANQRTLTRSLIIIASLMLLATVLVTYFWSKRLMRPLEDLARTTERIKKGEIGLRIDVKKSKDEIGELGESFNEMLDQIEALLAKQYETKLLLNQAEYNALQAQINPHFLYNTLETMSSIAEVNHCAEVSALCQSLSNLFRYSLDMKTPFAPVSRELTHLQNFIYVMNVRMRGSVNYEFDVDDEARVCVVPKLCIQPIVENALNHGLRNATNRKEIMVRAKLMDDKLILTVEDNGVGMDEAEVEQLNRRLAEHDLGTVKNGHSIGLTNINARVKMLCGSQYGICVESRPDVGTKVILTVARLTMEEAQKWNIKSIES